ncbi:hypothetical protein [Fictibacillus phosphorivorans]|uniref:hypothetical protein n=1 Tax=Fictibacillus phosphorivorans TaxID=1221500 RepID=UPI00129413AB|nr:hypothetical protein [Fictibacillus phosphorivorans]MQR94288.1 hypothetical protein [Fictibacillus phosphorivorans]
MILIRKVIAAIVTSFIMTLINIAILGLEFSIFIAFYLVPFVILYGSFSSMLSDYMIKWVHPSFKLLLSGVIHILFGLFFLIYILIREQGYYDLENIVWNIIFMQTILCSLFFWMIAEVLKRKAIVIWFKEKLTRIGELRL